MTDPQDQQQQQTQAVVPAMPWYASKVMTAFVTIVVSQLVRLAAKKWGVDLTIYDVGVPDIVAWIMNTIAAGAVAYGASGRLATAPVTLTKAKADSINASSAPPTVQPPGDSQK